MSKFKSNPKATHTFLIVGPAAPNLSKEREVKFFTETEENNAMKGPRTGDILPYVLNLVLEILFC
ncbi:Phytochrome-associated serine/threonine-protein phosphatase [Nymphaea thermarum]|nr:Phytochrome-associated serine/threonine-protein phosphatase [Nymphaea thermarum]